MPFFRGVRNLVINDGQFVDLIVNNSTGPTGIDILLEASTPEAAHDSSARDPPPSCFPGTREGYIKDIIQWAVPSVGSTSMPLYWMKGPAGVGKSAVAQTCIEKLKRQGQSCPAFFFSINGRNKHQTFFPSIAYQLATFYPEYHDLIDGKIRRHKALVKKSMETQFLELIVEPLRELERSGKEIGARIPVFVDGLDECESRDAQCAIVEIVTATIREGNTPLCWAFFSRPEPHIEATFSNANISPFCYMTTLPISRDADGDIELYLRAGFRNILRRFGVAIEPPWPSDHDIKQLVRATSGLFIYAKTVLRFVGQLDSLNPEESLRAVISLASHRDSHDTIINRALTDLDAMYMLVMQKIPAETYPSIRRVLTVLCGSNYSSAICIANLLGIPRVELVVCCNYMSASFIPPLGAQHTVEAYHMVGRTLGGSISFYHKSFQDFLLDPLRSGSYCIIPTTVNLLFSNQQRKVVSYFEKHHYWKGNELALTPGAPGSASNLSYPYSSELVNSLIIAWIYSHMDNDNTPFGADFDFRKHLYITTSIIRRKRPGGSIRYLHGHCKGFRRYVGKTILSWLQPKEFPEFDVAAFKKKIKGMQRQGTLWPRYCTSPSPNEPGSQTESALYVIGRGPKSIFWYWEINYELQFYREFRTLDLAEGERAYRREPFLSGADDGPVSQLS